jgi:CheY-like chemotaxis protein
MMGYEVYLAKDGTEAVHLYENALESSAPFDAVIMDLTVPGGVGGREAVQKLREIDPQVRTIVSSGYSNDPVMANYRKYGFDGVVAKPYNADELSEALQKLLRTDH